jgi:hypothetical protein
MRTHTLPGTLLARLQDALVLTGALVHRGIAVVGLRSLEYAFTRETRDGERQLRKPVLWMVRVGYWMLGGVATGKWNAPEPKTSPKQN